jgi:hypothetical protein
MAKGVVINKRLREMISETVSSISPIIQVEKRDELMTAEETALYFKKTTETIADWTQKGYLQKERMAIWRFPSCGSGLGMQLAHHGGSQFFFFSLGRSVSVLSCRCQFLVLRETWALGSGLHG